MSERLQKDATQADGAGVRSPIPYKWLLVIFLVATCLRLGFMLRYTPVISGDGCEYIRMGMQIRDGKPLTGNFEWPETMYGTLYPILIAGVSKLGLAAEASAYLLSLVSGVVLIWVAFLLARYVYGERTAVCAALLFASFPLFIGLSGSVFNESIYLTLWLSGIYWGIRAIDSFLLRDFLLTGFFFALSTLSRPEAFAYPLFFAVTAVLVGVLRKIQWSRVLSGSMALLSVWFLLMIPYVLFEHRHTGHYRFEGKWNVNYTLGERMDSSMTYFQAGFGLDNNLHLVGPLLDSSLYAAYTPYPHALHDELNYFAHRIHRDWPDTYAIVTSVDLGGPALYLLVVLGLFGSAWSVQRLRHEYILAVMALSIIVVMVTSANLEDRYLYPLPVILLLWAAAGIDKLADWARRTVASWSESLRPASELAGPVCAALVCAVLLVFSAVGTRTEPGFHMQREGFLGVKQAGLWLGRNTPKSAPIAAFEGRVAYYANRTLIILPYADSSTTLSYLVSKHVQFVALDNLHAATMPTIGQWYLHGIPDPRARLVYQTTQGSEDCIRIYSLGAPQTTGQLAGSSGVKE